TKKIESFKYRIYKLIFGLLQTRINPGGERGKKMDKKKATKKMITRKVLSCFVIFLILTSAVPVSVLASNSSEVVMDDVLDSLSKVDTHEDIVTSGVDNVTIEAAFDLSDSNITGNTSNSPNETLLEKAFTEKSFANQRMRLRQQLFGCAYD
ncbi:MAG: hypothetical protein KAT65_19695, partial [Methanophagales archaeon]|nr:hypothetical protein [Methanophagales archaeon]